MQARRRQCRPRLLNGPGYPAVADLWAEFVAPDAMLVAPTLWATRWPTRCTSSAAPAGFPPGGLVPESTLPNRAPLWTCNRRLAKEMNGAAPEVHLVL